MTPYAIFALGALLGGVIGNALAEPTIHRLSAKARLYLELYRRASRREQEERRRAARAEAQARDHEEINESIYIRRPAARPESYRRN